jgi:hypothetical protein
VEDIGLSIWEPIVAKQPKLDQILSLKTSQERPNYKTFSTRYSSIMRDIHAGEVKLSTLVESSQEARFEGNGISSLLTIHKKTLSDQFESLSKMFETILEAIVRESEPTDDLSGTILWLLFNASLQGNLLATNTRNNPKPATIYYSALRKFRLLGPSKRTELPC